MSGLFLSIITEHAGHPDYLIVDRINKRYWSITDSLSAEVRAMKQGFATYNHHQGESGVLYLGFISNDMELMASTFRRLTDEQREILEIFLPLHEVGHVLQMTMEDRLENLPLFEVMSLLTKGLIKKNKRVLDLLSRLPITKGAVKEEKSLDRQLERNAHAFGISLIRVLKHEGVDLMRGKSSKDLKFVVDSCLGTYEDLYSRVEGKGFLNLGDSDS